MSNSNKPSLLKSIKTPDINIKGINLTIPNLEAVKSYLQSHFDPSFSALYIIYVIFAISTFILLGYLLIQNSKNNTTTNKVFIWGLFVISVIIFIIHRILFFIKFNYKAITMAIVMVIGSVLASSALIISKNSGYDDNFMDMYNVTHSLNILTTTLGIVPFYSAFYTF